MKLPKQFRHWCYRLKLHDTMKKKKYRKYVALKGHGRWWRINSINQFQYSEVFETFDKWANSLDGSFDIPKTFNDIQKI